jgi:DNA-binding response OmpR family regulator
MAQRRPILIVARDQLFGDLLAVALQARGHEHILENGRTSALDRFHALRPDLTVVDLVSLGHNGLDLIADIKVSDPTATIVAMVADDGSMDATVYSLGVIDIVRRHDGLPEVVDVINRLRNAVAETSDTPPRDTRSGRNPVLDEVTTVLVVEDNEKIARLLERTLTRAGYRVLVAFDGIEAIECVSREDVHVMFLDLQLPRLGGLAVLRRLQDHPSPPRTVVLSGVADRNLKLQTIKLGAFDYMDKPVTMDQVLVAASAAVVVRRTRQRSFWRK